MVFPCAPTDDDRDSFTGIRDETTFLEHRTAPRDDWAPLPRNGALANLLTLMAIGYPTTSNPHFPPPLKATSRSPESGAAKFACALHRLKRVPSVNDKE